MERDFLITRILLGVTALVLIIWLAMWFLDHHALSLSQPTQTTGSASPPAASTDSTHSLFSNMNN